MMHIFSMKSKTKHLDIKILDDAPVLYLPLSQNIGKPAIAIVKSGDRVSKYQLIAKADGMLSANLHAPVSGTIKIIIYTNNETETVIVLENDFENNEIERETIDPQNLSPSQILDIIREAGIVGEGGAQFPTHVKYSLEGSKIDTFIINGTECEPYLSSDYIVMKEMPEQILKAILATNKVLKAKDIVISIEKQNKELTAIFHPFLSQPQYSNIRIVVLPNTYPQGGELQLIKSVTGKEIPKGILPRIHGVIVSNVNTIGAIYKAVFEQKPLVERIITLSGEKAKIFGNFRVKIGTPISHILNSQNITDNYTLVLGGPMMGKNIIDSNTPIVKGSSGVLFLNKKIAEPLNCIMCGYCADVCPMYLMPMTFSEKYRKEKYAQLAKYNIDQCIECAACEYICPSNVPLIESIKQGKEKLNELMDNAN